MKITYFIISVLLLANQVVRAELFEIKLEDVYGMYMFSEFKQFHIDLGTDLSEVHEARFTCDGMITTASRAGVFYAYLGENRPGKLPGLIVLDGYRQAIGTVVSNNSPVPFECDVPFNPFLPGKETWDFLLDGKADGRVHLFVNGGYFPEPGFQYPITGSVHSASIVITATPLPETGFAGITGFILLIVCYIKKWR